MERAIGIFILGLFVMGLLYSAYHGETFLANLNAQFERFERASEPPR